MPGQLNFVSFAKKLSWIPHKQFQLVSQNLPSCFNDHRPKIIYNQTWNNIVDLTHFERLLNLVEMTKIQGKILQATNYQFLVKAPDPSSLVDPRGHQGVFRKMTKIIDYFHPSSGKSWIHTGSGTASEMIHLGFEIGS